MDFQEYNGLYNALKRWWHTQDVGPEEAHFVMCAFLGAMIAAAADDEAGALQQIKSTRDLIKEVALGAMRHYNGTN